MAYKPITPGGHAVELLRDLARRREFRIAPPQTAASAPRVAGWLPSDGGAVALPGMNLHATQIFAGAFFSPHTPYSRLLLMWQPGAGKTIALITIGQAYVRAFRANIKLDPENRQTIYVIGFTKNIIMADMLKYPELGFVSYAEVDELRRLRLAADAAGPASPEARHLGGYLGLLRRKVTDRTRGGYYRFYGYKEFANRLFLRRGAAAPPTQPPAITSEEALRAALRDRTVEINTDLLAGMRGSLMFCDEIHDVYNMQSANNYGVAVQYALDAVQMRAVFVSAGPMTGSAAEVVDLLNLLVPLDELPGRTRLRREDFFRGTGGGEAESGTRRASQLLPGALERIGRLAAGRVSFLQDSDEASYPRRVFEGDTAYPAVPYLRFTECPMSPLHAATAAAAAEKNIASFTLLDIAFPNPDSTEVGLFSSEDTMSRLAAAPDAWRAKVGVSVLRGAAAGLHPGTSAATGAFLSAGRIGEYSTKYATMIRLVIEHIRSGGGKLMISHPRVRMSGVLLIQEILRVNGILDEWSNPTDATLCAACGAARRGHGAAASHPFAPARFVIVHSDVEGAVMERSLARFNSPDNLRGEKYKILVGSKIISQSYTIFGVQKLIICAGPSDISTLIQVFGRVVRKFSHKDLPPEERVVRIVILLSTWPKSNAKIANTKIGDGAKDSDAKSGEAAPDTKSAELARYIDKMQEYLVIQQIMRVLQEGAVDAFANYGRVSAETRAGIATLEALPYRPLLDLETARTPEEVATFEAYGYGEVETRQIVRLARRLFEARPVWTYDDLWAALRSNAVQGSGYDAAGFLEGNFALALEELAARPHGQPPAVVVHAPPFLVRCPARPGGRRAADVGAALPAAPPAPEPRVRIADYLQRQGATLGAYSPQDLAAVAAKYCGPEGADPLALIEVSGQLHAEMMRRLILKTSGLSPEQAAALTALYKRFGVMGANYYLTRRSVNVYKAGAWSEAPHASFGVGRRQTENRVVVGYTVDVDRFAAKFKIRPPARAESGKARRDARLIARGAVCETAPRDHLDRLAKALNNGGGAANAGPRPSAVSLCAEIKRRLLDLEADARSTPAGLAGGTRWLYLFADSLPVLR